jgi:O-acetyl-ADP-ribose deacetylase (regulator of RNase III)
MRTNIGATEVALEQGDITRSATDAVVNAANSGLLGGGGVDGAIHRAGGPTILEQCKQIRAERGRLPAGRAVITTGGDLPARHVIHTVGPIWNGGGEGEPATLASCYRESLDLAAAHGLKSIAFPSISTGAYGYPMADAARVALAAVREWITAHEGALDRVSWVLFDDQTFAAYRNALEELAA